MKEYYKPFKSTRKHKKFSVYVLNEKTNKKKIIHFGDSRYRHNYSRAAQLAYDRRSKGIKDGQGKLTYKNKNTANYWSRTYLWNL